MPQDLRVVVDGENTRAVVRGGGATARIGGPGVGGLIDDGDGEGEARAEARPVTFRPDPPAVRHDDALADRQTQPLIAKRGIAVASIGLGESAEEPGQAFGGDAAARVGDDHRHVHVVRPGRSP